MKPLIIRASAGTGKTYRLSLEFINVLLTYRVDFDEILVITFTKKATAEIRERIFLQIQHIVKGTPKGAEICKSLTEEINPDLRLNADAMKFLAATYQRMLTHKADVSISTIDSFINRIFSGVIAPYHNLGQFTIDNGINEEYLPELYEHILDAENRQHYEELFHTAAKRNLKGFDSLITQIIDQRWIFEFIEPHHLDSENLENRIDAARRHYHKTTEEFCTLLCKQLEQYWHKKKGGVSWKDVIAKKYLQLLSPMLDDVSFVAASSLPVFLDFLTSEASLDEHFNLLLEEKGGIWNGTRIRNPELKEAAAIMRNALGEYLFLSRAITEQSQIISLAAVCLAKYDQLKFRDKIFTHSDISYYTFRFLYDPELSLINRHSVLNLFYEQLSYTTRFILIDEFQDTSVLQWSIFKPLIYETLSGEGQKDYGNLIVVGDEKQAIYGWRGGERRLLSHFDSLLGLPIDQHQLTTSYRSKQEVPKGTPPKCPNQLTKSYRSKPLLMEWLNGLFASPSFTRDPDWDYVPVSCAQTAGGYVQVQLTNRTPRDASQPKHSTIDVYREFVANRLVPALDAKTINPADTAILMRRNKDLDEMAAVLEAEHIPYALQSSGSLFVHDAVHPVVELLKFLCYEDPISLLAFLRSDAVLMGTTQLKKVMQTWKSNSSLEPFFAALSDLPALQNIGVLWQQQSSVALLIQRIMELFNYPTIYPEESDMINLHRLVQVALEFQQTPHPQTLGGFLEYIHNLENRDEYSQIGQAHNDAITLLTIHKSKGLQFETVCTFFDITSHSGNHGGLSLYHQFSDDFMHLDDLAITLNFGRILQNSHKKELLDAVANREAAEELNTIYVALTRAKRNLFVCLHFNKKGGVDELLKKDAAKTSVPKRLLEAVWALEEWQNPEADTQILTLGELSCEDRGEIEAQGEASVDFGDFIGLQDFRTAADIEAESPAGMRQEFLYNKSVLVGNIVHEFLSHIPYLDASNLNRARKRTTAIYGTLLPSSQLQRVFAQTEALLSAHRSLFDAALWDRVFTEYTVFDANGREYRIDRLQINTAKKTMLIVDYKTGRHHDEQQLITYEEIMRKIPAASDYSVKSQFLEIAVSLE